MPEAVPIVAPTLSGDALEIRPWRIVLRLGVGSRHSLGRRQQLLRLLVSAFLLPWSLEAQLLPLAPNRSGPGEEATAATALYEAGQIAAGCESFLHQLRQASRDPWSIRGAARCAATAEAYEAPIRELFDSLPEGSVADLFARASLHEMRGEYAQAEPLLRGCVELAPTFALAWNSLGTALRKQDDPAAAIPLIEHALRLQPELEEAAVNLERARIFAGVFPRLLSLLRELPRRWDELGEPLIPCSGLDPSDILEQASEEESSAANTLLVELVKTPPAERKERIQELLAQRPPNEVDLWTPNVLWHRTGRRTARKVAAAVEAWLQWAEAVGRRDALTTAAALAIQLPFAGVDAGELLDASRSWTELPLTESMGPGHARLLRSHAALLASAGRHEEALATYRRARGWIEKLGEDLRLGTNYREEGEILLWLGRNAEALEAFQRARQLFILLDHEQGQANALHGEAEARFALASELGEKAALLRRGLANPPLHHDEAEVPARDLWEALLAPFAGELPESGSLLVVPHGPLHQVPFALLTDPDGRPLFERFAVSVVPSLSALAVLRRCQPANPEAFVALIAGAGVARPAAITEIALLFGDGHRVEDQVDDDVYRNLAPGAGQLLIMTRGAHVPHSRTETFLEITPSDGHDGRLNAAEIATIPLRAELVTLAACDTAAGEALMSDERLDLARAFLIAGTSSVLATRWKIPDDEDTIRFLLDFYRAYRQEGLRKDEALTVARHRSRRRGDPAQVWAAWVLIGDPG